MDYEQKLKEALSDVNTPYIITTWIEEKFPELVESEDERIRKQIRELLLDAPTDELRRLDIDLKKAFNWLEKQGKQHCNVFPIDDFATEFEKQVSYLIASSINKENDYTADYVKWVSNALLNYAKKELEKQGANSATITNGDTSVTSKEVISQPTASSTIEPKFKVGDWVVDSQGLTHQIGRVVENVTTHTFGYDVVVGGYFNDDTEGVHLWAIEDAKDGDVLACGDKVTDCPFIFHNLTEELNLRSYCGVNTLCQFQVNDENGGNWCDSDEVRPATKEQRELLFQKMKEAGYEWDAKKKELKLLMTNGGDFESKNCEQNSAWSEEDSRKIGTLSSIIYDYAFYKDALDENNDLTGKYAELDKWLQTFPERFTLQSEQEWSEEDEHKIKDIVYFLDTAKKHYASTVELDSCIDWLKSLKQRYTWKPSEEQMKFLQHYADQNNYDGTVLTSLLNDLKKLTE